MALNVVGTVAVSGAATALNIAWPGGHASGDVLLGFHSARMNDTSPTVGGATKLTDVDASSAVGTRRRLTGVVDTAAGGSEAAVTLTDAGQMNVVAGLAVRGYTAPSAWFASTNGLDPISAGSVAAPGGAVTAGTYLVMAAATASGVTDLAAAFQHPKLAQITKHAGGLYAGGAGCGLNVYSALVTEDTTLQNILASEPTGLRYSAGVLVLVPTTAIPVITGVDSDRIVLAGQTSVAITGTGFGTTNADRAWDLVQGATVVAQTETGTGTSTAATLTIAGGGLKYGTTNLRCTRDSDSADGELPITLLPASGHIYVDIDEPNTTAAYRITATADIAAGDQIEARGVGSGSAPTGLVLNHDGSFEFEPGATPASFDARVWDASDSTWGAWATQTIAGGDVTSTGAATAPAATAAGTGTIQIAASGAATAASATAAGTGAVGIPASGAATAPAATAAGTGAVTHTSSGAASAPAATASGAGTITVTSSGAATAPSTEASGSGSVSGAESGSGAVVAPKASASGSGTVAMASTAVTFAPVATASGSGTIIIVGSGACIAPSARASGFDVPPLATGGRGMWGRLRLGLGLGL
jgi:hypothetical protein